MEQLTEERMRLYEGTIPLVCSEEDIEQVIPFGTFARSVAERYPHLGDAAQMTYRDFAPLLTEVWRDYDCHLAAIPTHPELLVQEMEREGSAASSSPQASYTFGVAQLHADKLIGREVIRARETLERVLLMLQASEEYLPLHASLRCAARGFTDVRNALSLFSDASQCLPASVSLPRSTMLK